MSNRTARLDRRHFLRGTGAAVALPLLTAMSGQGAAAAEPETSHRFVAICGGLGFHAEALFPEQAGPDYKLSPYLEKLKDHRDRLTVFSGLSHQEQNGNNGHASEMTWLTSARRPGLAGFKNTVSLDQVMAQHIGGATRYPHLCLSNTGGSLSWTANGVNIPAESSPSRLYQQLFVAGSENEIKKQMAELRRGRSILDAVSDQAKSLNRSLGPRDQAKLDEYFTAVRDLETRIKQNEEWATRPKPEVQRDQPQDVTDRTDIIAKQALMYEMMALALQTDSTRVITLALGAMNAVPSNIPGVQTDWHNLSHHGRDEAKIEELQRIEIAEFEQFNVFLSRLAGIDNGGQNLLDGTSILFGSNLGNASAHDWHNLPIVVAGGGYKHGQYVAHDAKDNTPLANMFVTFAQRMGIETDVFGQSTAAGIRGLETA